MYDSLSSQFDYGLDRIEVVDNGCGVAEEDMTFMVLPGYTSKIKSSEDLLSLSTYGFRGHGLSAVAAVSSRVTIASGFKDHDQGLALSFDSQGNVTSRKVLPWNGGTRVTVEEVFKNIPVRRKYLDVVKAKSAQLKKIQQFLHTMAIACPGVGLSLHHNKSVVWTKVPVKTMREAIGQVYGISTLQMLQFSETHDHSTGTTVRLFVPKVSGEENDKVPSSSEPDKSIVLVNKRPVHVKEITQCLQKQFSMALGIQDGSTAKHPISVTSIEVLPSDLDVNLEPDKTAVAFAKKDAVLQIFEDLVKQAFSTTSAKDGDVEVADKPTTTRPVASEDVQNRCQGTEEPSDSLDWLLEDFMAPDKAFEDEERSAGKDLPPTPDGNKENMATLAEKTDAVPHKSVDSSAPPEGITAHIQVEKTLATPKKLPAPLAAPPRQPSLWSLGAIQNSQGRTVAEPTAVGDGLPRKRPMVSPMKDRTPSKKMRTPSKSSGVQRWIKDMLGTQKQSAKEVYCARRKEEILSQVPEMPLEELSELLEEGWASLTPDKRQEYQKRADGPVVRSQPASSHQPPPKAVALPKPPTSTWKKVELKFSMRALQERFEDYCHLSQEPPSLETSLVGMLRGCPNDAWVVWHKAKLCTLNTVRLREAITFRRLLTTYSLPSEAADPPISVTSAVLGGDHLWNALLNMNKESRDMSGTSYVTDPLLTRNGFHVRILSGSKAEIVQVPRDQALSELVQILKTVATHHPATVADCRLPRTLAFFREEAARMVRNMPPGMSPGDLRELLTEQGDLLDELCVHNRPICTRFFDIGSSAELAQQESMVG